MGYGGHHAGKRQSMGMGGMAPGDDGIEFLIAGATAVQVGTANFVDPFIWTKLTDGLASYMDRHHFARVSDITGSLRAHT